MRKPKGTSDSHAASPTAAPTTSHFASRWGSRAREANVVWAASISRHILVKGLPAVGATLVVALSLRAARKPGDHKGSPYTSIIASFMLFGPLPDWLMQATSGAMPA